MSKVSYKEPHQMTPEWRVHTAATLLNKLEVADDLSINYKDDSHAVAKNYKERSETKRLSRTLDRGEQPTLQRVITKLNPNQQSTADDEESHAVIKRNIQDQTLTIDSDQVKLIHGICSPDNDFDITCTLVEIDMFSMRDLMTNYRTIVLSGGRNVQAKDIIQILDTMINDVRRLCTRSPRLFRMSTRSLIAKSVNTRYGVDYGSVFVTLTTSEGIRKVVEKSSTYYLSLNDNKVDQDYIRPKFLQMLVLLLSLLNDQDLQSIRKVLESTFKIPGDRAGLELLIMKVLPLGAINSEVFLESLFDVYKPEGRKQSYEERLQGVIWKELQQDMAHQGYLLPVPTENQASSANGNGGIADDLEADLEAMLDLDLDPQPVSDFPQRHHQSSTNHDLGSGRRMSWLPPWPMDGILLSTVFKYLQHDGFIREDGNSTQTSIRAINEIPHLEITSADKEKDILLAIFTTGDQYRLSALDTEFISSMQKGQYVLTGVNGQSIVNLEIGDETLNEPFLEATLQLNILISKIKAYFGGREQKRKPLVSFSNKPSVSLFSPVEEPREAKRFWADIVHPNGERQCCAVAFKVGNRVVFREDILREMNSSLAKLTAARGRLNRELLKYSNSVKKMNDEAGSRQQQEASKMTEILDHVKRLIEEAKQKRSSLQTMDGQYPEDPITKVIYPSFGQAAGERPEWQSYKTQLAKDKARLIVKSKRLTVGEILSVEDHIVRITFEGSSLVLSIENLTSTGSPEMHPNIGSGDTVLWLGYYLVVVEAVEGVQHGYSVLSYFKVKSQLLNHQKSSLRNVPLSMSVLV